MKKKSSYDHLKQELMAENSKRNMNRVAKMIGNDKVLFKDLLQIMTHDEDPYNRRAAWAITAVTDEYPELLKPHLKEIIPFLKQDLHEGIIRSLLRQLPLIEIPEKYQGVLFDICFNWAENPKYALAVRANALTVLYNISNLHKELKNELIILFEQISQEEAPAMKARGVLLLKKLKKETLFRSS